MQIKLNGQLVEAPASGDGFLGYRWFVRVAGFDPNSDPRPVLSCQLPNGTSLTVGYTESAPLVGDAEYTVTV